MYFHHKINFYIFINSRVEPLEFSGGKINNQKYHLFIMSDSTITARKANGTPLDSSFFTALLSLEEAFHLKILDKVNIQALV